MNHPFLNIIGIIVIVGGLFFIGQNRLVPLESAILPAAVATPANDPVPVLKPEASAEFDLEARAFISAYVAPDGTTETLVEKDSRRPLPIASLTKLMTAYVAMDELNLWATTTLSDGKVFTVKTLLNALLVESNNDSAEALAKLAGREGFIAKMNEVAQKLGMDATFYINPSGLDELELSNTSSASDLLTLAKQILDISPEIWRITNQVSIPIVDVSGVENHVAQSTDELLTVENHWPAIIIGGKTGTTDLAKENLVLILKDRKTGGYLVNVILGAEDRFTKMTSLVDWVYASYEFNFND